MSRQTRIPPWPAWAGRVVRVLPILPIFHRPSVPPPSYSALPSAVPPGVDGANHAKQSQLPERRIIVNHSLSKELGVKRLCCGHGKTKPICEVEANMTLPTERQERLLRREAPRNDRLQREGHDSALPGVGGGRSCKTKPIPLAENSC
jgi:hypothetical protein